MPPAVRLRILADAALIVGALAAPFIVSGFTLFQLSQAICYGIGVLGLKLLSGFNGQFSLGHSIFFAVGAYTTATLTANGFDIYLTLPLAAGTAGILGFVIGWPALRIRGHHLAVVTLVFALATPQIARWSVLQEVTGGPAGIGFSRPAVPIGTLSQDEWWYALTVVVAAALIAVAVLITRSRLGRSMQASRDNPIAARANGVNTAWINTLSFAISASFAGLAGGLMMGPLAYVGPDSFGVLLGIGLFVAIVITGPTWIGGAFVGGLLIIFLPNWAEGLSLGLDKTSALTNAVYGVALLAVLFAQLIDWRRLAHHLHRILGLANSNENADGH